MRTRQPVVLALALVSLTLLTAAPAPAVSSLSGQVVTMTGNPIPDASFTMEREEDEQDGKTATPVVVKTDGSGAFKVNDLQPGTYRLRSNASGVWVTDTVTVPDGQAVTRSLLPSTDPENPGAHNFGVGLGGFFTSRDGELSTNSVTTDGGSGTQPGPRLDKATVDTNAGFAQVGYGLPQFGVSIGSGYLSGDTTVYGRIGAGTTTIDFKGPGGDFSIKSGASLYAGGGVNLKLQHSGSPVYGILSFSGYYMDLSGLSTTEPFPAGSQHIKVDGSQYGFDVGLVAGAQLGQFFPASPSWFGMINVQAGVVGSWMFVDTKTHADQPGACHTIPGPLLGPFPDSPRGPDQVVCDGDTHVTFKRDVREQTVIGGRLAITVPIVSRLNALVQGDISSDWWSIVAKLNFAFDP
jgi:hypothetical protein